MPNYKVSSCTSTSVRLSSQVQQKYIIYLHSPSFFPIKYLFEVIVSRSHAHVLSISPHVKIKKIM